MSVDCTTKNISWRTCCSSYLLMFFWQSLQVFFGSLSCMSINPWPTSRVLDGIAWSQYAVIAGLIQFTLQLVQISNSLLIKSSPHTYIHHNGASSMLYDWCDTRGCSSFINSLPHIDPPIWPKYFELCFVSPKDFILVLHCPVTIRLGPQEPFDIVLLPE